MKHNETVQIKRVLHGLEWLAYSDQRLQIFPNPEMLYLWRYWIRICFLIQEGQSQSMYKHKTNQIRISAIGVGVLRWNGQQQSNLWLVNITHLGTLPHIYIYITILRFQFCLYTFCFSCTHRWKPHLNQEFFVLLHQAIFLLRRQQFVLEGDSFRVDRGGLWWQIRATKWLDLILDKLGKSICPLRWLFSSLTLAEFGWPFSVLCRMSQAQDTKAYSFQ